MKAKILSNLTASVAEGEYFEPHGTVQHVAHIPRPGVIIQMKLGAAGLQYCRAGVQTHVIPREALIALFEKLEPKFGEAPNGNTKPKDVDELGAPMAKAESENRKAENAEGEKRKAETPAAGAEATKTPSNGV